MTLTKWYNLKPYFFYKAYQSHGLFCVPLYEIHDLDKLQTIYQKFDKSRVSLLPRTLFDGKIIVINGEREAEKAVEVLSRQTAVGIDTETRPTFHRGRMYAVALLQVATRDLCFLFRLNRIGMPACVVQLLESAEICKIGLSLADDFMMLRHRKASLNPQNFIDLQHLVPQLGIEDMSLQKLYANLLGGYISKRQQLTNWEADSLTLPQQAYAATDAWACLVLHDKISELIQTNDYHLILKDDQNNTETR